MASAAGASAGAMRGALESLARRRVIARMDIPRRYFALRALLPDD